jgi:ribosome-associated protein
MCPILDAVGVARHVTRATGEVRLAGHDTEQVDQVEQLERIADEARWEPPAPDVAEASALAHELIDVLVDRQASDVVLLDLSRLSAFADFFVIATVDNVRQARAIVDALDAAVTERGGQLDAEGSPDEGWILADAGKGVFVHLFSLEARVYYNLEGLWHRAQEVVRIQ